MAITNHERIGKGMDLLRSGLAPFVEREVQAAVKAGTVRMDAVRRFADDPMLGGKPAAQRDVRFLCAALRRAEPTRPLDRDWQPATSSGQSDRSAGLVSQRSGASALGRRREAVMRRECRGQAIMCPQLRAATEITPFDKARTEIELSQRGAR